MEGGKEGRDKGRATEGKGRRVQRAEAGGRERGLGQDATGYGSRAGAGGTNEAKGESETSPPLEAEDNFSPAASAMCPFVRFLGSVSQPFAEEMAAERRRPFSVHKWNEAVDARLS